MEIFRAFSRIFILVLALNSFALSAFGAILDTDNFDSDADGWSITSGGWDGVNKRIWIDRDDTATKTYNFGAIYASATVTITMSTTEIGGWEDSDVTEITANGSSVYNSNVAGSISFSATLNASGQLILAITPNTNNNSEDLAIDTISIEYTPSFASNNLRSFAQAFTSNEKGNIKIIGNSVLTTATGCTALPNNSVNAINTDQDSDGTTFNSTSANLVLPTGVSGSDIKYAGLYWQGRLAVDSLSANQAAARTLKLKLHGGSYQTLTSISDKFNWRKSGGGNGDDYQGVYDITSLLQQNVDSYATPSGYSQPIWVANILTHTGTTNLFGAWSIIIVYHDDTATLKNLTVYDGYLGINTSTSVADKTVTLSGFVTPSTYPVNASFLIFGGEGDINYGDSVSLSDNGGVDKLLNSGGEVFKSTITDENGTNITSRNPACSNTIGVDIHSFNIGKSNAGDATGIIGTNQTSTIVKLDSFTGSYLDYDTFFPGVFAFATDLYQPNMCYMESIFDSTGANISGIGTQVNQDEVLRVQVLVKNDGMEIAKGVQVLHYFDNTKFPYEANTTKYDNFNASFAHSVINATDATDADNFEYNGTNYLAKINLGNGANSSTGGEFVAFATNANAYSIYEYNATVEVMDQNFSNDYYAAYRSDFGLDYSANPTLMQPCEGGKNSFWGYHDSTPSGNIGINDAGSSYDTNPNISTKISNKPFNLRASYLNQDGQVSTYDGTYSGTKSVDMQILLYEADGQCANQDNIFAKITIPDGSSFTETTDPVNLVLTNASKEKKFKIVSFDYGNLFRNAVGLNCGTSSLQSSLCLVPACFNSAGNILAAFPPATYPHVNICVYGDGGGSAPCDSNAYNGSCGGKKGGSTISPAKYNIDLGCAVCLADAIIDNSTCSDNFAIRPDKFILNTSSLPAKLKAGEDYSMMARATIYNSTITSTTDYNQSKANVNIGASKKWFRNNVADTNGTMIGSASFGNLDFSFIDGNSSDISFKFNDVGIITLELNDTEWANIDSDDTNISQRAIEGEVNATFIPFSFDFNSSVITNNNGSFTYLSNDLNMSAKIPFTVRAVAKDGNITQNYSKNEDNLFEQNATIAPFVYSTKYNNIGASANTTSINNMDINFTNGAATVNATDTIALKFNFTRLPTNTLNPFDVNGSEANITIVDTDGVYGDINQTLTGSATFFYGRVHAPRYVGVSPIAAKIYYEAYCKDCNQTMKNMLGSGSAPTQSVDSLYWYQNQMHTNTDGNVTQFSSIGTTAIGGGQTATSGTITNGIETISLSNSTAPYTDNIKMTPNGNPSWLVFNPYNAAATYNDFEVEFIGGSGSGKWAGDGNLGKTISRTPAKTPAKDRGREERINW